MRPMSVVNAVAPIVVLGATGLAVAKVVRSMDGADERSAAYNEEAEIRRALNDVDSGTEWVSRRDNSLATPNAEPPLYSNYHRESDGWKLVEMSTSPRGRSLSIPGRPASAIERMLGATFVGAAGLGLAAGSFLGGTHALGASEAVRGVLRGMGLGAVAGAALGVMAAPMLIYAAAKLADDPGRS